VFNRSIARGPRAEDRNLSKTENVKKELTLSMIPYHNNLINDILLQYCLPLNKHYQALLEHSVVWLILWLVVVLNNLYHTQVLCSFSQEHQFFSSIRNFLGKLPRHIIFYRFYWFTDLFIQCNLDNSKLKGPTKKFELSKTLN
jgi:hypothetical protein